MSILKRVPGGRGRETLYIGCIYMPTTTASASMMDTCYENLRRMSLFLRKKVGWCY